MELEEKSYEELEVFGKKKRRKLKGLYHMDLEGEEESGNKLKKSGNKDDGGKKL